MLEERDSLHIPEFESLKAPERSEEARLAARARILAAAEPALARRRAPSTSWEVLAAWARPGLVAASIALLVLAGTLQLAGPKQPSPAPVALEDVLASGESGQVPAMLLAINEPDADALVAAALLEMNGNGSSVPAQINEVEGR